MGSSLCCELGYNDDYDSDDLMSTSRVAVVTGANKGIGYHIADQLVKAGGLRVIVACRDASRGQKAAAELGAEYAQLDISDENSIANFINLMNTQYGRIDILVNNAALAFKAADPTPFKQQTKPTLRTNFYGTMALSDGLLPLLRQGQSPRLVNVASMAGKLGQVKGQLQSRFSSSALSRRELVALVQKFEADVAAGRHQQEGWGNSNYGMSKLALIAYTKLVAREEGAAMRVNACCPGYCDTDMTSHRGPRPPAEGAKNATMLALLPDNGGTGEFIQNMRPSQW
eukprot:gnl/MRDRNA2_/MRDRNA2_20077_c0_seq1.p1 gnl/MRDRNA2_/MRDRNA2_20077_c0~~gnl/MRDRNA2_/MRDRNA2_20077_c0_seq1.p1  ORF type:complete len:285 (-),score=47.31 gnl/MRDRNA2_/MRDRNA2_20077_c0_seq1:125-979(-)